MPLRNLTLLLITIAFSVLCFSKATRNRYGSTLAEGIFIVSEDGLEKVDSRELFERAMVAITSNFDDYTVYIPPIAFKPFQESLDQEFGGIGIELDDDGRTVRSPVVDGPAYRAGVRSGDVILTIDGESTSEMDRRDLSIRLRGRPGTNVRLRVQHADELEQDIVITRDVISVESVKGDFRDDHDHWRYVLESEPKIGYVRVVNFGEHTANELQTALASMNSDVDGLIIDLRDNAGGLLTAAVHCCDLFLDKGTIVTTRGRDKAVRSRYDAKPDMLFPSSLPMVVLTNHESASASEIMAACLQDHGRAVIVGERTFGKGTVQNVYPLEGGRSAIKLTVASYWRPSGKNIHRLKDDSEEKDWGVRPNPGMEVTMNEEQVEKAFQERRLRDVVGQHVAVDANADPQDLQLQRAIDYLHSRTQ
jgi:carboxyl-terminal processing protease